MSIYSRPRALARLYLAAWAATLGLALSGAASADNGQPSAWVPAAGHNQQASALAMVSLHTLMSSVNHALNQDPGCAGEQPGLCALVQFSLGERLAGSPLPEAMLDRCDLDGATPVCRIDLVRTQADGQRQAMAQLELSYAQGQWLPRGEAAAADLGSAPGLQTARR